MNIIETVALKTWFGITGGVMGRVVSYVRALDEVDIQLSAQEIVAVVGESGCGKSTLGLSIAGLVPIMSGSVSYDGSNVNYANVSDMRNFRRHVQMVFQDPFTSLNPRHSIYRILSEPLKMYNICHGKEMKAYCAELLKNVGLSPDYLNRFPHEFSGGQRQRISIARSIAVKPRVIICDEVVSALDVSVQAQIVQLLLGLKKQMGLSLLFITHDLSLVKAISDRVYVMYLGKVVETSSTKDLFSNPRHPYTRALLDSIPTLDRSVRPKMLGGEVPSPVNVPPGCVFRGRCVYAQDDCAKKHPPLRALDDSTVACYHPIS